jgi:hypothetical protein
MASDSPTENSVTAFGIKSPDGSLWLQTFGTAALAAQYCAEGALSEKEFNSFASHNQRWPALKKRGYKVVMVRIIEHR